MEYMNHFVVYSLHCFFFVDRTTPKSINNTEHCATKPELRMNISSIAIRTLLAVCKFVYRN